MDNVSDDELQRRIVLCDEAAVEAEGPKWLKVVGRPYWIVLMHGHRCGVSFGWRRESGIWRASRSQRRLRWHGHDSLYVAAGRWRLRIVKPWVRYRRWHMDRTTTR
jgi:hypothetical protein